LIVEQIVEAFANDVETGPGRARYRRPDLRLALHVAVRACAAMAWLGHRDLGGAVENGSFTREIADMLARYLVSDASDA
jgi:hypothetical protein